MAVPRRVDHTVYTHGNGVLSRPYFGKAAQGAAALYVYAVQLVFNFFWPVLFFSLKMYLAAFIWLVLLWLLILAAAVLFCKISKPAGLLLIPYLLWVAFAGYLNFAVYLLN